MIITCVYGQKLSQEGESAVPGHIAHYHHRFGHFHHFGHHQFFGHPMFSNLMVSELLVLHILALLMALLCIWMILDLAKNLNLRGNANSLRLFFISCTHWIGSVRYSNRERSRDSIHYHEHHQQPRAAQTDYRQQQRESFRDYREGYQQLEPAIQEHSYQCKWQDYEEPHASYPEMIIRQ